MSYKLEHQKKRLYLIKNKVNIKIVPKKYEKLGCKTVSKCVEDEKILYFSDPERYNLEIALLIHSFKTSQPSLYDLIYGSLPVKVNLIHPLASEPYFELSLDNNLKIKYSQKLAALYDGEIDTIYRNY